MDLLELCFITLLECNCYNFQWYRNEPGECSEPANRRTNELNCIHNRFSIITSGGSMSLVARSFARSTHLNAHIQHETDEINFMCNLVILTRKSLLTSHSFVRSARLKCSRQSQKCSTSVRCESAVQHTHTYTQMKSSKNYSTVLPIHFFSLFSSFLFFTISRVKSALCEHFIK